MLAKQNLIQALGEVLSEMDLPWPDKLVIEEPRDPAHGDLSTNAALLLARTAKRPPRELAADICRRLAVVCPGVASAEVAGPGFCNFRFAPEIWQRIIAEVEEKGGAFGHSSAGRGRRALVEYVSANPTGPLHVGHGRGAAIGDSVARLLRAAGYEASTEYYLNDAGRQMSILGNSVWTRLRQILGDDVPIPEDFYKGDYIRELAAELLERHPEVAHMEREVAINLCRVYGQERILEGIKTDLAEFRCEHQRFFSESSLVDSGAVAEALQALAASGRSFEADGALWFESKSLGDDQNRVLRKSDGSLTYFATDIAYHHDKFARDFDWLIDVWGADHHGYIPRMRAAIVDMGKDPGKFNVLLVQLVNLLRDGEPVNMSTRGGVFVTLREVMDEVGVDAARFMFLSRSSDSPLDFDLELAKQRTMENPVYYVQYGHARVCALLRRAREKGIRLPETTPPELSRLLDAPEELALLRQMAAFSDVAAAAARALAPHHISRFALDLAGSLHSYYAKYKIIDTADEQRTLARLALSRAIGQTLANALFLLGVHAPDSM